MESAMPRTAQIIAFPSRIDLKRQAEMSPGSDFSSAAWYHAAAIVNERSQQGAPGKTV